MRLICPNCEAQYEVDAAMLPPEGRDVQCSACGQIWFEFPETSATTAPLSAPTVPEALSPQSDAEDAEDAPQTRRGFAAEPADSRVEEARFLSDDDLEAEDAVPASPIAWQTAWDQALDRPGRRNEADRDALPEPEAGAADYQGDAEVWGAEDVEPDGTPPAANPSASAAPSPDSAAIDPPAPPPEPDAPAAASTSAPPEHLLQSDIPAAGQAEVDDILPDEAELLADLEDLTLRSQAEEGSARGPSRTEAAARRASAVMAQEDPPAGQRIGRALEAHFPPRTAAPPEAQLWEGFGSEHASAAAEGATGSAVWTEDAASEVAGARRPLPPEASLPERLPPEWPIEADEDFPSLPLRRPAARNPRPDLPPEDEEDEAGPLPEGADLSDVLPRRPRLDDDKLALLREEVERETRARAAEAARHAGRGVEYQPDLGLPEVEPPVRLHIGPRTAPADPEDLPRRPVAANPQRSPRRELLPDIERINQTLSASGTTRGGKAELPPLEAAAAQRRGFRRGFLLSLGVAVLLMLIYQNAPLLAAKLPQLQPALNAFVAAVDTARLGIDQLLRRLLDSQSL